MKREGMKHIIQNNIFLWKYIFRHEKKYTIFYLAFQCCYAIAQLLGNVVLAKVVIDTVQYDTSVKNVLLFCIFVVLINIIITILNSFFQEKYTPIVRERLGKKVQTDVYERAIKSDLQNYDNPEFYNKFVWVVEQAEGKIFDELLVIGKLLQSVVAIFSLSIIVFYIEPIGLLFVILSFLIDFMVNMKNNRIIYMREMDKRPLERKNNYICRVFNLPQYAKEIRLSNVKEELLKQYKENNESLKALNRKTGKQIAVRRFLQNYIGQTFLLDTIYMSIIIYKALVLKTISLGSITAIINSMSWFKNYLYNLSSTFSQFIQYSYYVDSFFHFFQEDKTELDKGCLSLKKGNNKPGNIIFRNVSFSYGKENVLSSINLMIHEGEKVAIVGYNGAGKTTFIKLLLRLYEAQEGYIEYKGNPITQYDLFEYRKCFGTVFQDYSIYAAKLSENVKMDYVSDVERRSVQDTLIRCDFKNKLESMQNGIDEVMLREFNQEGLLLSGGETQKVAISRAMFMDSPIIILDEPTSSIDPISEYNLNQLIMNQTRNKTVFFVSHRLNSTRGADRIILFDKGRIAEMGNHEELMKRKGLYAKMFRIQMQKYEL